VWRGKTRRKVEFACCPEDGMDDLGRHLRNNTGVAAAEREESGTGEGLARRAHRERKFCRDNTRWRRNNPAWERRYREAKTWKEGHDSSHLTDEDEGGEQRPTRQATGEAWRGESKVRGSDETKGLRDTMRPRQQTTGDKAWAEMQNGRRCSAHREVVYGRSEKKQRTA